MSSTQNKITTDVLYIEVTCGSQIMICILFFHFATRNAKWQSSVAEFKEETELQN